MIYQDRCGYSKKLGTLSKLDILDLSDYKLFAKSGSLEKIIFNFNLNLI